MISYCVYKFVLDDDMTSIVFRRFNGKGDEIYPTLSFCFKGKGIFDATEIRKISQSKIEYTRFLFGKDWDERLLDVEYDNVTLELDKMLKSVKLHASNGYTWVPIYSWQMKNGKSKNKFLFRVSYRSPIEKCFSFDINVFNVPKLIDFDLANIELKLTNYSALLDLQKSIVSYIYPSS